MLKYSRQREIIKHCLSNRHDHPTADEIYASVKKQCPNISLATVYRNLSLLADMGEIIRVDVGDGMSRFDGCTAPHYHFICNECGAVEDIFTDSLPIVPILPDNFAGEISGHCTYFYGRCAKCKAKYNNK